MRKWWRRYQSEGISGLKDRSKRPHNSPNRKLDRNNERLILRLRKKRNLGVRRIHIELIRNHDFHISTTVIHRTLIRNNAGPRKKARKIKRKVKRYAMKIPGERVQIDVCKIAPKLYQYTAIDDCSRMKVVSLYPRRTAANSLLFLDEVFERLPFPIQRIQTDRGKEFFAYRIQERLMEYGIKFRPIKPGSPHLNGKVERTQKTDLEEFYTTVNLKSKKLSEKLAEWEFYYNWHRPHSGIPPLL